MYKTYACISIFTDKRRQKKKQDEDIWEGNV